MLVKTSDRTTDKQTHSQLYVTPHCCHTNTSIHMLQDHLVVNHTALAELSLSRRELSCAYSYVTMADHSYGSTSTTLLPSHAFEGNSTKLSPEYNSVAVKCGAVNGTKLYENILIYLPPPVPVKDPLRNYSVTLFFLESTSQMGALRGLPATVATFERLGAVFLKGHQKVGENTSPNMAAIHLGDIFKVYQQHGYFTLLFEDFMQYGTSIAYPFTPQFSSRAHYLTLYESGERLRSNNHARFLEFDNEFTRTESYRCQQEQLLIKYQFPLITDFHVAYKDRLTFAQFHLLEGTHDDLNFVKHFDTDLNQMVLDLASSGVLNDTFFFLLGDHGPGHLPFRATKQGHTESTMPLLLLLPPASLARDHPDLLAGLRANQEVLTTHHDLNLMLREVLALGTGVEQAELFPGVENKGSSLFRPLPLRTCSQAGVPLEYCSCSGGVHPLAPETLGGLARGALRDMNLWLAPLWGCGVLTLSRVVEGSYRREGGLLVVEVKVEVAPRNASFLLRLRPEYSEERMANLTATVTRLDRYQDTAWCVPQTEARARPYCVCQYDSPSL